MYSPVTGTFEINGQTFFNFEGEFISAQPVITAYLDKIGGEVDEDCDFWGLPDDDNIVVDSDGRIGILSNSQLFTVGGR